MFITYNITIGILIYYSQYYNIFPMTKIYRRLHILNVLLVITIIIVHNNIYIPMSYNSYKL